VLAVKVSGPKSKKDVVSLALKEFIAQRQLADLFGTLEWDETFEYKKQRGR
jgi:hypothetical protein